MIESVLMALIWICVVALVVWLIFYVLENVVGLSIPEQVKKILWVIALLICLLFLARAIMPGLGLGRLGAITSEIHAVV